MKTGFASCGGVVYGPRSYFGEAMLLADYRAPNGITSLTFLEVFQLSKHGLYEVLDSGRFPATRVSQLLLSGALLRGLL